MVFFTRRAALTSGLALIPAALRGAGHGEVVVAAAANLTAVFQTIGPAFERETGIHPVFSFASTAQLARQIEERGPFDVLAAADTDHTGALERKGLTVPGSRAVYATGILALWLPESSSVQTIGDLSRPQVRVIAAAKPELAPYGQAAVEALQSAGIWEAVKSRMVYAPNVGMVLQYGTSGNADAVFTAMSLARTAGGRALAVDARLHKPLDQELAVTANAANKANAAAFVRFLLTGRGRDLLAESGYRVPGKPSR